MKNLNELTYGELQISVNIAIKDLAKKLQIVARDMEEQWSAIIHIRKQQIKHIKENRRQDNEEKLKAMELNRVEPRNMPEITPENIVGGLL